MRLNGSSPLDESATVEEVIAACAESRQAPAGVEFLAFLAFCVAATGGLGGLQSNFLLGDLQASERSGAWNHTLSVRVQRYNAQLSMSRLAAGYERGPGRNRRPWLLPTYRNTSGIVRLA